MSDTTSSNTSLTLFIVPTNESIHNAKVHIWSGDEERPSLCQRADRKNAYRLEEHPFGMDAETKMCRACSFALRKILDGK